MMDMDPNQSQAAQPHLAESGKLLTRSRGDRGEPKGPSNP